MRMNIIRRWARIAKRRKKYGNLWSNKSATSLPCDVWDMNLILLLYWLAATSFGWNACSLKKRFAKTQRMFMWWKQHYSLECSWLCLKLQIFQYQTSQNCSERSFLEIYWKKKHVLCPFWLVAVSCWFSIHYSAIMLSSNLHKK